MKEKMLKQINRNFIYSLLNEKDNDINLTKRSRVHEKNNDINLTKRSRVHEKNKDINVIPSIKKKYKRPMKRYIEMEKLKSLREY